MSIQREEHPHNTPEQVREYVREGLAVVAELEVPDDLRVAAFTKAVDLASAKSVTVTQLAPVGLGLAPAGSLRPGL